MLPVEPYQPPPFASGLPYTPPHTNNINYMVKLPDGTTVATAQTDIESDTSWHHTREKQLSTRTHRSRANRPVQRRCAIDTQRPGSNLCDPYQRTAQPHLQGESQWRYTDNHESRGCENEKNTRCVAGISKWATGTQTNCANTTSCQTTSTWQPYQRQDQCTSEQNNTLTGIQPHACGTDRTGDNRRVLRHTDRLHASIHCEQQRRRH
jgi:hypothetical protein